MRHFISLTDISSDELWEIFSLADDIEKYANALRGRSVVMFFPSGSIRTRVTFEKGVHLLGGQSILFPPEALDKREAACDVAGYLSNWADCIIVRHDSLALIDELAAHSRVPIINAMTRENHPCEVLCDLYALSKLRGDFRQLQFTFVGADGNIGRAWREAAQAFGLRLRQCCPESSQYAMDGVEVVHDLNLAMRGTDVVLTDSLSSDAVDDFAPFRVTAAAMREANSGAVLNPCPPFFRGEEVAEDAIASEHFVGYEFKRALLTVQQALMVFLTAKLGALRTD